MTDDRYMTQVGYENVGSDTTEALLHIVTEKSATLHQDQLSFQASRVIPIQTSIELPLIIYQT